MKELEPYFTPESSGTGEILEKKSRFIGELHPASDIDRVNELLTKVKKTHYAAKHHCSAYILLQEDGGADIVHSSDDGEPSGTAGRPILDVMKGAGLKNAVLIVTRYFGGILLGPGGLSRAYQAAAKAALENTEIVEMRPVIPVSLKFSYGSENSVRRYLRDRSLKIEDSNYSEKVEFRVPVPAGEIKAFVKGIADLLSGSVEIEEGEPGFSCD